MRRISNFLLQLTLIAVATCFVTSSVKGQFRDELKNGTIRNGGGGGIDTCVQINGTVTVQLLINALSNNDAFDKFSTFGCELYVGLTSFNTSTTFVPIESVGLENYEMTTIEIDESIEVEDLEIWVQSPNDLKTTDPTVTVVDAVQMNIEIQIPKILYTSICQSPQSSQDYLFVLNLYCKDGDDFIEINPCLREDFFYISLLDECSLEQSIDIDLCCWDEGTQERIENDQIVDLENDSFPVVSFNNHELLISSPRNDTYSATYEIMNFSGQKFLGGSVQVHSNEIYSIDVAELPKGIYVSTLIDSNGVAMVNKFVKL